MERFLDLAFALGSVGDPLLANHAYDNLVELFHEMYEEEDAEEDAEDVVKD